MAVQNPSYTAEVEGAFKDLKLHSLVTVILRYNKEKNEIYVDKTFEKQSLEELVKVVQSDYLYDDAHIHFLVNCRKTHYYIHWVAPNGPVSEKQVNAFVQEHIKTKYTSEFFSEVKSVGQFDEVFGKN